MNQIIKPRRYTFSNEMIATIIQSLIYIQLIIIHKRTPYTYLEGGGGTFDLHNAGCGWLSDVQIVKISKVLGYFW